MGSKSCMNEGCRVTTSSEWKSGWALKSGGFATLCVSCGFAYEKSTYCSNFHQDEDGWRECRYCRKRVHCGCSASKTLLEILDFGGVGCASCIRQMEARANASTASLANASTVSVANANTASLAPVQGPVQVLAAEAAKVTLAKDVVPTAGSVFKRRNFSEMFLDGDGSRKLHRMQKCGTSVAESSLGQNKGEGPVAPFGEKFSTGSPHFTDQPVAASPVFARPESQRAEQRKELYEAPSLGRSSLNISLNSHLPAPSLVAPFSDAPAEGSDQSKVFSPLRRPPQLLPKPPKPGPSSSSEAARGGMAFQARIARPPVEGRGRCQLLPRYWPRITEQELQQISGDLKSPIVPLFEKVLSASDAGRIGRLVLPKACAEAYFPTINQSEGLPINIQDVKGKEWTFQFRFWPNNNSRMYVLEGVTPCIQNMNLQAGDTVTFSRRDPGGQLVMGFRKSTSNVDTQEPHPSVLPYHGGSPGDTSHSGDGVIVLETAKNGGHTAEDSLAAPTLVSEKKKARNLGTKNKRLHMHDDDAVELRVTWEEAQELLRPPPMNSPTVVKIDNYEFEEYNEPPVFGKKTVFTVGPSGQQEQWTQCDSCRKWRKLPVHVLVPARWTCPDNIWDANSASCLAADVINPREQESLHIASRDYGRRIGLEECEPSGLDALATAAVLGGDGDLAEASVGATTKHPRHRPGCSCIVCIQPPSGKGKHPGNCKCTVCLTVKRRFKTLMQRKKKRQSDREAELAQGLLNQGIPAPMDLSEMEGAAEAAALLQMTQMEAVAETAAKGGGLDLNCHPGREDDMLAEASAGISMDSLMDAAGIPLDMYLRQNRLSRPDAGGDAGGGSSSSAPGPGKRVDEDSERV